MDSTASTIAGVSRSARETFSLVASDVRATDSRSSRSTSFCSLNVSRNCQCQCSAKFSNLIIHKYLQCLRLCNLIAVGDDSRMQAF